MLSPYMGLLYSKLTSRLRFHCHDLHIDTGRFDKGIEHCRSIVNLVCILAHLETTAIFCLTVLAEYVQRQVEAVTGQSMMTYIML